MALGTDPTAAPVDTDSDGIMDDAEVEQGSDPLVADEDLDGCNDGEELAAGTTFNKADTDEDGVDDCDELAQGTNPLAGFIDTDGDRLSDDRERQLGTNATTVDSDGDGIDDAIEVGLGTDPLDPNDTPALDISLGASIESRVGRSDPQPFPPNELVDLGVIVPIRDDDLDGVSNEFELAFGFDPNDPTDALSDTDNDGLTLRDEFRRNTDPTKSDMATA